MIMKLWTRPGWRGAARRVTRTTPSWREWSSLRRLDAAGVSVARGLSRFSLEGHSGRYSDVLVIEDLGEVQTAQQSVKAALTAGRASAADAVDGQVIEITKGMFAARVLDDDHSMVNCLCDASGKVFRVDLEVSRIVSCVSARRALVARMIARLVTSYVYTVQPDTARAATFAARIADGLHAPRGVLRRAKSLIDLRLDHQRSTKGLDVQLPVDW